MPPEPPAVAEVTVAAVMRRGVIFCERQATAGDLADTMIARGVHSVAVLGHAQNDRHDATVWGIVSDVDLLAAALDPETPATAGDLARQPVIVIRADRPIGEAATTMATYRANHLVVIDPDTQAPVGFISPLDVAAALLPQTASAGGSSPFAPRQGNEHV
ncbi:MAG TPA: CBS domain-containing protein [Mycobacteriales bacterium]